MGVWIETSSLTVDTSHPEVTPYVGVWIETYSIPILMIKLIRVTPYVGVWIETLIESTITIRPNGHTLRGCVD